MAWGMHTAPRSDGKLFGRTFFTSYFRGTRHPEESSPRSIGAIVCGLSSACSEGFQAWSRPAESNSNPACRAVPPDVTSLRWSDQGHDWSRSRWRRSSVISHPQLQATDLQGVYIQDVRVCIRCSSARTRAVKRCRVTADQSRADLSRGVRGRRSWEKEASSSVGGAGGRRRRLAALAGGKKGAGTARRRRIGGLIYE
jgi:hypothetical protein